jgi:methionyl-tRNA synthetase
LTFIICEPLAAEERTSSSVKAKVIDADDRMIGDINLFIYQDDESEVEGVQDAKSRASLRGEIDVMIADSGHRRKGYGTGSVQGMLIYLRKHLKPVLEEYTVGLGSGRGADMVGLMVKIKEGNAGSRRLFESLGFKQSGDVNYFGEVMLVISWGEVEILVDRWLGAGDVYREVEYEA